MDQTLRQAVSKVPEVTLGFWVVKVIATTLGETGGDSVTMTLGLGHLVGTMTFVTLFIATTTAQIIARRFHLLLYWAAIMATTPRKQGLIWGTLHASDRAAGCRAPGAVRSMSSGSPRNTLEGANQ